MYSTAKNMKRPWAATKVSYKASEIQRAGASLTKSVERGALKWLKAKFEHYALEAVPNVWEGDEGMMKHVPKFPMPPCIALPLELGGAEAEDHRSDDEAEDAEIFDKDDTAITAASSSGANKDFGAELKRRGMERGFWIKMAKVVMCIESMNQSIMTLRNKFANEYEKIMKQDCQELVSLYKQMQKIKFKLDKAAVDYKKNEFTNLFVSMTPSKKIWFKQRHKIQGKLPNSFESVLKKYNFVRTKIREVLHKNPERFENFKDILTVILKDAFLKANKDSLSLKIVEETEENKNGEASCLDGDGADKTDDKLHSDEELDEEGKSKKRKTENVDGTEDPDAMLSKEDLFWENLTGLKKMMHKAAVNLSRLNNAPLPDATKVFWKHGSNMCRQMLNVRKSIISFSSTLVKLKEEMQTEGYEDKKPFTAEELATEGIEGLTPDNSLAVVETMLNKIKDDYLRVQDEKYFVLEKFGYTKDVHLEMGSIDQKVQVFRVCSHSKTAVDLEAIGRLAEGPSKSRRRNLRASAGNQPTPNAAGESKEATASPDAGTNGQENPSVGEAPAGTDNIKCENLSSENAPTNSAGQDVSVDGNPAGEDSNPIDVAAAGDGADDDASDDSSEDSSNLSRNVNSLGFFMKNLGPDALTVSEQSSSVPVGEDFTEKERQYWDRLQELLRIIDNAIKKVRAKSKIRYFQKRQIRDAMHACHQRLKQLSAKYELAKVEAVRSGYCTHVVYENLEFQPESAAFLVVRDLDHLKLKINTLYRCCRETAGKLGVPYMFKF